MTGGAAGAHGSDGVSVGMADQTGNPSDGSPGGNGSFSAISW